MKITETMAGAIGVLAPQGALVGGDAKQFRDTALEALERRRGRLIVDVGGCPFADSEGLEALLDITEALSEGGRTLKLCNASDTLREALELVGLAGLFELHGDVNAAARSFL
jgi:anti-anti-sigma factor